MESTVETAETTAGGKSSEELSKLVDWLTAGFLVLAGLFATTIGVAFYSLVDRDQITEMVADGSIESPQLTDAELVDVSVALATWGGIGTAITGLLLIAAGVAFLLYRRRVRNQVRQEREIPDNTTLAIVGAVVTGVTSFLPLSPIIGGAAAGYLKGAENWDGVRVGALAGVVAASPIVLFLFFLLGGFVITAVELGLGGVGLVVALTLVFSVGIVLAAIVGLSALGGYLGARLSTRNAS